jgi:hypothetical protein
MYDDAGGGGGATMTGELTCAGVDTVALVRNVRRLLAMERMKGELSVRRTLGIMIV